MQLLYPSAEHLASYANALSKGWSPDNTRPEAAQEQLAEIALDPVQFIANQVDREARGAAITLPDGSTVPRLPGFHKWMWDGEFCGAIGFRWQPGTNELPPYCLGHIGYSVVPWKRGLGYATQALGLLLADALEVGLDYVELTAESTNAASQRVIQLNGGVEVERFRKVGAHGGAESIRFRIQLVRDRG